MKKMVTKTTTRRKTPTTKRRDGITNITVNGVGFTIISSKVKQDNLIKDEDILFSLGNGKYVYSIGLRRDDLYKAASYDTNKIDFAVPQNWLDQPKIQKRFYGGDRAVWSYEKDRWGAPVWDSEAKRRLKLLIKRRLAARRK